MKADKERQKIDRAVASLRERVTPPTELVREAKEKTDRTIASLREGVAMHPLADLTQESKEKAKRFPLPRKPKRKQ